MPISPELQVALLSLCQGLIWPIFISIFIFCFRSYVFIILGSISRRIEQGDPFQAGPISLGKNENKLTRLNEIEEKTEISKKPKGNVFSVNEQPLPYKDVVYLVHTTTSPSIDVDGVERYNIQVMVDADSEQILDKIEKVEYHLHPTFSKPNRETKDRKSNFGLMTRAWGEFNLSADIYFKGYKRPLIVYRYLNYQGH